MKVSSVQEMHRLDRRAITEHGIPDYTLMDDAGGAVYHAIRDRFGVRGRRFTIIAGPGNNGGDSFVVARKLNAVGATVRVFVFADVNGYRGPALTNYEVLTRSGVELAVQPEPGRLTEALAWCDAVVDGLLGTGLTRPVEGLFRDVVEEVNASERPVFSIDIPSGIDGDTGHVRGAAIRADTTVTFGLPKWGNLLHDGAHHGGSLVVTHLSFPPKLTAACEIRGSINAPVELPAPGADGPLTRRVLFIDGSGERDPAIEAATRAFARVADTEPSVAPLGADVDALFEPSGATGLAVLGLGRRAGHETRRVTTEVALQAPCPLLIAGAGAAAILEDADAIRQRPRATILVLSSRDLADSDAAVAVGLRDDPVAALRALAAWVDATVVLEAPSELIGYPDGNLRVNLNDPPVTPPDWAGATTGTIAAAYGLGLSIEDAVATGVFLRPGAEPAGLEVI